jgi:Zn-dependent peptidase ImmA (M78 family)
MAKTTPTIQEIEEREANLFAMELLMPEHFVETYITEHPTPKDYAEWPEYVRQMAAVFVVEEGLVIARLASLGIFGGIR